MAPPDGVGPVQSEGIGCCGCILLACLIVVVLAVLLAFAGYHLLRLIGVAYHM
jgi:hypothetical protein